METDDFYEFMLYEQMEPFGDRRLDLLVGLLCSLIANVNRDPKTIPQPFKPSDFMPEWDPKPIVKQSQKQIFAMMKMIQALQNTQVEQAEVANG